MLRNQIRAFSMLVLGENQFSEWEIHIIEVSHEVRNRFSIGDFLLNDPAVIEHRRVIAATNRVPWGMAIATGRRCAGSLVGRSLGYVFSHFFDLGAIGVDLKRHFNFSASGRFLGFFGGFWGVFWVHRFSSWVFWKWCNSIDTLGRCLFWGFCFGGVENLEHENGSFWGVIGFMLTANADPVRSLSRLGKIYFGRGYRTVLNAENAENAVVKNAISNAFKK